jgi:hypothetical protein
MIEDALNLVTEPNSVFKRFKICFYLKLFFYVFLIVLIWYIKNNF